MSEDKPTNGGESPPEQPDAPEPAPPTPEPLTPAPAPIELPGETTTKADDAADVTILGQGTIGSVGGDTQAQEAANHADSAGDD